MKCKFYPGDCLQVLPTLADNSIDSCVTDPPYHLISIVNRFGAEGAAPVKTYKQAYPYGCNFKGSDAPGGGTGAAFARMSKGFMGKVWDGGDLSFKPSTWKEVYRVLKPGAHLLAFGGTRTFHRLACAIEDAGFEIRDTINWVYGSGFPKSHDVSKGIDKRKDWIALPKLQGAIAHARKRLDITQSEAARRMGLIEPDQDLGGGGFMWFETGMRMPTREQWPRLKATLRMGDKFDLCFEQAEREITGTVEEWKNRSNYALTSIDGFRRDVPVTDAAKQWQGWGTALKPACELIVLARKPLSEGTVAANVLKHGTGALNIDGCRVGIDQSERAEIDNRSGADDGKRDGIYQDGVGARAVGEKFKSHTNGRWPANLIHDNSDEVRSFFPDSKSTGGKGEASQRTALNGHVYGKYSGAILGQNAGGLGDTGSAARFFYHVKASKLDRNGSSHPTVKPINLLRYLVRLITPKGGTCIDPFAGTGTLAAAAHREGAHSILIESDPAYQQDIRERLRKLFTSTAGVPNVQTRISLSATGRQRLARERADRDQTIIPWA